MIPALEYPADFLRNGIIAQTLCSIVNEKDILLLVIIIFPFGTIIGQNLIYSKTDSLVDVRISLSEESLFDAEFEQAKKSLDSSYFRDLDGIGPKHEILLTVQDIRITGFMNIVYALKTSHFDNFERLNRLLALAEKLKTETIQAKYFLAFSSTHRSIGNLDSASIYQEKAISLFRKNNNLEEIAKIRATNISRLHNQLLQEEKKQEILMLIPKYQEEIEFSTSYSKYALAYNTRHLAQIHRRQTMNYQESLKLFKTSLALRMEIGFKPFIPASHSSLGDVYAEIGECSSAIELYLKSSEIAEKIGFVRYKSDPLLKIGDCYLSQNNKSRAMEYYMKSLDIASANQFKIGIDQATEKINNIKND